MLRVFHPTLIWAICGAIVGGALSASATILYIWFTRHGMTRGLLETNAALGALIGAHMGLLVAYLRSYASEAPDIRAVAQRDPLVIALGALLLVYAISWVVISL
jgi:hypothetical protein